MKLHETLLNLDFRSGGLAHMRRRRNILYLSSMLLKGYRFLGGAILVYTVLLYLAPS